MTQVTGILAGYLLMGREGLDPLAASSALNDEEEVGAFGAALGVMTMSLQEVGYETGGLQEEARTLASFWLERNNRDAQVKVNGRPSAVMPRILFSS